MALCWRQPRTANGTSAGVTISQPPGTQDGDVLIAFCLAVQSGSSAFFTTADWVHWRDVPVAFGGSQLMLSIFSKIATGEPISWTFSTTCTACLAAIIPVFDDGGAAIDVDLVATSATVTALTTYTAPSIVPSGSADPFALVLGCWASGAVIALPTIGAALLKGSASTAQIVVDAYPATTGNSIAPTATGGATAWIAAQVAIKSLAPASTRRMVRGISAKFSTVVPVPSNVVNGDLMLAFVRSTGSALSTTAGWTPLIVAANNLYGIYSRTASSEPSSYTFTNAAEAIIAAFFDLDGSAIGVDTLAAALSSGTSLIFTTPFVVTNRHNTLLLSHFASQTGVLVGPYGPTDAAGAHLDYATESDCSNLLSYALQGVSGQSASRAAYTGANGAWVASQVAILGQGLPTSVGPDLFPELPGLAWSMLRTPEAGLTVVQKSQSGKESRWSLRPSGRPTWTLTLAYEVLRANRGVSTPMLGRYLNAAQVANLSSIFNSDTLTENEFAVLSGFFNRQGGAGRSWLFEDANDCIAGLYQFGRGDGLQTAWSTGFASGWQNQFPSAPLLYTDYSPSGIRLRNTFGILPGTLNSVGLITPTITPTTNQPLYITAPTASYSGHPLLGEPFATGNGSQVSFQLTRWFGGMKDGIAEPIQNLNGLPAIWVDGVQQTPIISSLGIVTFSSAPARNAVLSWAGKFYTRCRFLNDSESFEEFAWSLYSAGKLEAVSVLI